MSKKTVSYSLTKSTVDLFDRQYLKYQGTKTDFAEAILKPSLRFISKKGLDKFRKILSEGG